MSARTIVVCEAQVPFVEGGAEALTRSLVRELRARGHLAELVSLPFKWYPKDEILTHAAAWRLLDLTESNHRPIDRLIATKFPSYFARHPNKVVWLVHQYRAAYDLFGTPFTDLTESEPDVGLRARLFDLDHRMLAESRRLYSIAGNVSARLDRFNGLHAETLYPPPRLADQLHGGPFGDYVLSVGRLEGNKRVDLLVAAMRSVRSPIRLVVVGEGMQRANLERAVADAGVEDRVEFLGWVDDRLLVDLYAGALAIAYPPYDEDYGYVTVEAFLARKPVITTSDAGGPLEFVDDDVTGLVCDPSPDALADAVNRLALDRRKAADLGAAGAERVATLSWDHVIERLLAE
jgi:glycosyltransferase involved in cell wall biosynthesis